MIGSPGNDATDPTHPSRNPPTQLISVWSVASAIRQTLTAHVNDPAHRRTCWDIADRIYKDHKILNDADFPRGKWMRACGIELE